MNTDHSTDVVQWRHSWVWTLAPSCIVPTYSFSLKEPYGGAHHKQQSDLILPITCSGAGEDKARKGTGIRQTTLLRQTKHLLGQQFSNFFISRPTEKALKVSKHTISIFCPSTRHTTLPARGSLSPMAQLIYHPPPNSGGTLACLQTIHGMPNAPWHRG